MFSKRRVKEIKVSKYLGYHTYPKYSFALTAYHTGPKILTSKLYYLLMCLKASEMNSVDPD